MKETDFTHVQINCETFSKIIKEQQHFQQNYNTFLVVIK